MDQLGNRVAVDGHRYVYDGNGRMLLAFDNQGGTDGKTPGVVDDVRYDGFGNRVQETSSGTTVTYGYDAANRVVSSSLGEAWSYDAVGNVTFQRDAQGNVTTTSYDAMNRAASSHSSLNPTTSTSMTYDGAGNLVRTRFNGDNYGYSELTTWNVQYREVSKDIGESSGKGVSFSGHTSFVYDANANLLTFDRGRYHNDFTGETKTRDSAAYFTYDFMGNILTRADTTADTTEDTTGVITLGTTPARTTEATTADTMEGTTTTIATKLHLHVDIPLLYYLIKLCNAHLYATCIL